MATKNKQIRSFYLDNEQLLILEGYGNNTMSTNKALQEILSAYMDKEYITPREKIILNTKKIINIVKAIETNEDFKETDKEAITKLTQQITEATERIYENLNKI